ncbi:MAG: glycosyltransferase [Anaerostipes hadrus]|nr:glycosyltransferase [Anaerostipes hadrus]
MKKKILFIMPSMFIGGAERSLLGLLEALDYSKVDVSLFLYRHEGEFLKYIPKEVHILPEIDEYKTFDVSIKSLLFSDKYIFGIKRIFSKIAIKWNCFRKKTQAGVWMSMQYTTRYLQGLLPQIPGEYDLGIMYLGVADTLVNKVNAKVKMTWNHTDYDTLFPDKKMDLEIYKKLNYLVSVSEACNKKVKSFYPEIAEKAIVIENCLAEKLIKEQAKETVNDFEDNDSFIKLLSIGRYCEAKNFDNIPEICKNILETGINIRWYIIGYGGDEPLIKQKIKEYDMEEYVILLGKKDNPYPYIANCDIYIQPSRYEGKCVSVREAQMLNKPVIITKYETSSSQLNDGVDGIIVPMENVACAEQIARVIRDKELQKRLIEECEERDYSNREEVEKIYRILIDRE